MDWTEKLWIVCVLVKNRIKKFFEPKPEKPLIQPKPHLEKGGGYFGSMSGISGAMIDQYRANLELLILKEDERRRKEEEGGTETDQTKTD